MKKIKIPKEFMGVPVTEETMKEVLENSEDKRKKESKGLKNKQDMQKPSLDLDDLSQYVLVEGKKYYYPDILVPLKRLPYTPEVEAKAKNLGLNLINNDQGYIGNINWEESHNLLRGLGRIMVNPRQYVDFLQLLRSGKAYDGNGNIIPDYVLQNTFEDITAVRNPWRAEWLDAKFRRQGKIFDIVYWNNADMLTDTLMTDKNPGIDLETWIKKANEFGLPKPKIPKGDLYYYAPRDGAVAGFYADSGGADLNCIGDPSYRGVRLGVRAARLKI